MFVISHTQNISYAQPGSISVVANETSARNDKLVEDKFETGTRALGSVVLGTGFIANYKTTDLCIARVGGMVKPIQVEDFDGYHQDDLNPYGLRNREVVSLAPCASTLYVDCNRTRNLQPGDGIDSLGSENAPMWQCQSGQRLTTLPFLDINNIRVPHLRETTGGSHPVPEFIILARIKLEDWGNEPAS